MEEKKDARKLPREVLEEKCRQAHHLRKSGMTRAEIGEIAGVHADTMGRWLKFSPHDLKVNRGGRNPGNGRHLTQAQEARVRKLNTDKAPEQLKLNNALGTREAVMMLIEQETGIRSDSHHECGYAPKGKTPVIRLNARRSTTNMISAVNNQGKVRFKIFQGSMNTDHPD